MDYSGYKMMAPDPDNLAKLYVPGGGIEQYGLLRNEYLIATDASGAVVDYFKVGANGQEQVRFPIIKNNYIGEIKPRNPQQYCAMDLLLDRTVPFKIIRGVYGSGKDFLMFNAALELIERDMFKKIIYIRPHVGVGDLPDIGALPGTAEEKLAWTLAPLYDKVGGEYGVSQLVAQNKLEMVPLNFIRGRSFENSLIYVTEGQNMTKEIVKLIIGRAGEGSELWINCDTHQTDKRIFDRDNGVTRAIEKLKGNKMFGYVYLPKTERSDLARLADLLDEVE